MQFSFQMFKQGDKSPQTPKAVHYFQHFPSNFLRPYGLADQQPPEEKIFRRIAPLNCEWLTRPKVAASEFADTVQTNLSFLSQSDSKFIRRSKFSAIEQNMHPFLSVLQKFNTLKSEEKPTADDVKNFLKNMLEENPDLDKFFAEMFQLGGAMYLLGSHYAVVQTLLCNPEWSADKTVGTSDEVRNFKSNPTVKGLKKYLTETCTSMPSTTSSWPKTTAKRNLAQLLDSDDDDGELSSTANSKTVVSKEVHSNKKSKKSKKTRPNPEK